MKVYNSAFQPFFCGDPNLKRKWTAKFWQPDLFYRLYCKHKNVYFYPNSKKVFTLNLLQFFKFLSLKSNDLLNEKGLHFKSVSDFLIFVPKK